VIADLIVELTGAEAALAVNNTASAVLLAVNTLASGRTVVVSSNDLSGTAAGASLGELLSSSGARVRSVGARDEDGIEPYGLALDGDTALVVRVHHTDAITPESGTHAARELARTAHAKGVHVLEIMPGASLIDLSLYGLAGESMVPTRLALGADLVAFGGDTTVGGPQAGIVAGSSSLIQQMSRNPLHHALRCGKLAIAALEGTLRLYREAADVVHEIPALRTLTRPLAEIEDTARRALPALASALGVGFRVVLRDSMSRVSSESGTTGELPTKALAIEHDYMGAHRIAGRFRQARPPIIGRVEDDFFLLDARTVFDPLDLVPNWTDELEEPARYPL
jgi:L-seryl-tRNA(Ser) seleniumtransferase